ncbi:hypothetical protein LCGC14_1744130, partial [marine sediment metagenome]
MALFKAERQSWNFSSSIDYSDFRLYSIMDYALHVNNTVPNGICSEITGGPLLYWVLNSANQTVYEYNAAWAFQSTFALGRGTSPSGIDHVAGDDTYWVIDSATGKVYKYNSAWVYQTEFSPGAGLYGLTNDGSYFYTCHNATNTVKKYNGAWVLQETFNVESSPLEIDWDGTYFYVVCGADDNQKVYKYDSNFNLKSDYYDISSAVSQGRGINWNSVDSYFYVLDGSDDKAKKFEFGPNLASLSGHNAIVMYNGMRATLAPINQIAGNFELYLRAIDPTSKVGIILRDGAGNACINISIDADKIIGDGTDALDPA